MNAMKLIKQGTIAIIPENALVQKLEQNKKLIVKLGMDPTAPDLHLGHAIVLRKLRTFQDLGHIVVLLIGDFTARIGDPTGKSKTRPSLTEEIIKRNTETYVAQVGRILDLTKVRIEYNSTWLSPLTFSDVVTLCSHVTVARLMERDDFSHRLKEHQSIGFHELLYPLMQAYDSVALKADIELGGTDQTFNLLMGRFLQEQYQQEPQVIITTPIIEGLDGVEKMSKSLGNYIGLMESATQAFGKLMSISDNLMWRYRSILLLQEDVILDQMRHDVAVEKIHPMNLKKQMAHEIIATFWSTQEADDALLQFEAVFQDKNFACAEIKQLPDTTENKLWIVDFLKLLGAVTSSSEAKRLIENNAVTINDVVIDNFKAIIYWDHGVTVRVGKHRLYKIQ